MANHLIHEKSPYLLQHAHNPVDWYPWGEEAFEKAKRDDKPIFLSVGYSTCHWCHVMERESFESEQIASLLNESFVPVKVDREERPDVDRVYMTFVQATTGSGGWPMSVFLTPERRPFFGGTYFPPDNRYGRPGFAAVLQRLARAWREDRARIDQSSTDVLAQLSRTSEAKPGRASSLDKSILDSAFAYFRRTFDSTHGGFGDAPKFPRPVALNFLLRYYARTKNEEALHMVLKTLRGMAEGGMNDQLGGGFHRYSVDEMWFVPHFEKMLYDQAQLAVSYLEAYQITGDAWYAQIAQDTLDYLLRDMTNADGAFYSAEDADSVIDSAHPEEKGEGAFYVWNALEIGLALGDTDAQIFGERYGVEPEGNVHNDPQGEFKGKNILYVRRSLDDLVIRFRMDKDLIAANLERSRRKLLERRAARVRPHLDDKILTAWNGLMISAFAKAGQVLNEPRYAHAARRAADFILGGMYQPDTRILLRRYRGGEGAIPGFLDDYAFLAQALLDLYETEFRVSDLERAMDLTDEMLARFEDREGGAFFSTASGDSSLPMRMKDDYDGAEPSGNSVALLNLQRLAQITGRDDYRQAAERTLNSLASKISAQPVAVPQMLVALNDEQLPKRQIILVGDDQSERMHALLREVRSRFLPGTLVFVIDSDETREKLSRWQPQVRDMKAENGKPSVYVCQNFACQVPVSEVAELRELLQ